jgi:hypothetical protein
VPAEAQAELEIRGDYVHEEALRRERLVQLDEIDLVQVDSRSGEQLPNRRHGPDPHHARVDSRNGAADERAERLDAKRASALLARDHERGGAVVDPARVSGRDRPAFAKRRLERRHLLGVRVGSRVLVPSDAGDFDDLFVEAARLVGGRPTLLRAQRELVLFLAAHPVPIGDVLARLAHRLEREHLFHARVREAPAERRVPDLLLSAATGIVGFCHHERGAAHGFDSPCDEQVAVTGRDRMRGRDDSREP